MTGPALPRTAALHVLHHRSVEAHPTVKQEVPASGDPEPDPAHSGAVEGVEQPAGRVDRVVGHADDAGEHVGAPAGERGQCRISARQAVGGLIQRAIAAKHYHKVGAVGGCGARQEHGVAPPGSLRERHFVIGRQRLLDHHPAPCGYR